MHSELVTIRDYIRWAASEFNRAELFFGHGTEQAWDEAVFLVTAGVHLPWDVDREVLDARLTKPEQQALFNLIERRVKKRIPAPYLVGHAWFAGAKFLVNENVLIPRSPIGELIEQAYEPWVHEPPLRVLDMCTGSGCIGLATAMVFDQAQVDLVDISPEALAVAKQNIQYHDLDYRVQAIESNLFAELSPEGQYDLIVSNPPYVDQEDFDDMPSEFHHEPELGLVSGNDGLDACREILRSAPDYLSDDGLLIVEVGNSAGALQEAYPQADFTWLEFERGGHGVFLLRKAQLQRLQSVFAAP